MKRCSSWVQNYRRWRKHRRGAAIVELAVILPVFLVLILGAIELGRAVMVKQILEEVARAGCRIGTMEDAQAIDVISIVDLAMSNANITNYTINIDPPVLGDATYLEPVTVSVSVPFANVALLSSSQFMDGTTLTGTCVMPAAVISNGSDDDGGGGGDDDDGDDDDGDDDDGDDDDGDDDDGGGGDDDDD